MKKLNMLLVIILVLGVVLVGCGKTATTTTSTSTSTPSLSVGVITDYSRDTTRLAKGGPSADFKFRNPDGTEMSLSGLQGKPVLINFWKSDCVECVEEMPYIQQIYDKFSSQGLQVLLINASDDEAAVKGFMQEHNINMPAYIDGELGVAKRYNVVFLPVSYLIDKSGIIQVIKVGAFENVQEIEDSVAQVLP